MRLSAKLSAGLAAGFLLVGAPAFAFDFKGDKTIVLHTRDGKDIAIGTVAFTPQSDGSATYRLAVDTSKMKTFFLSMRDFKCEEGPDIQCFVAYPYKHPAVVKPSDLSWLEHDLLFFWKAPNDYGAKLQNGIYYALKPTDRALIGTPQAIDLNAIAAPPDDLKTPPYGPGDRDDYAQGSRWVESLRIE